MPRTHFFSSSSIRIYARRPHHHPSRALSAGVGHPSLQSGEPVGWIPQAGDGRAERGVKDIRTFPTWRRDLHVCMASEESMLTKTCALAPSHADHNIGIACCVT